MDTAVLEETTGKNALIQLDHTGDTKLIWDPKNADELAQARLTFATLKAKGFMAYRVDKSGDKGDVLREFDPAADKIIMSPPTVGG